MKAHRCLMDFLLQVPPQLHNLWDLSHPSQHSTMPFLFVFIYRQVFWTASLPQRCARPQWQRGSCCANMQRSFRPPSCWKTIMPSIPSWWTQPSYQPWRRTTPKYHPTSHPPTCSSERCETSTPCSSHSNVEYVFLSDLSCVSLQVSQISSIFECLLDEEEKALKEHPDASRWAEVVLNVNDIVKVPVFFSPFH